MSLLGGVHHVTFLTEDIDRLSAFYERVFDASTTLDMTEEVYGTSSSMRVPRPSSIRSRSSMGRLCRPLRGPCSAAAASTTSRSRRPPRGRFASPASPSSRRAAEGGPRHEDDVDHGLHDPDGFYAEVIWRKPELPDGETLPRADWQTVELG